VNIYHNNADIGDPRHPHNVNTAAVYVKPKMLENANFHGPWPLILHIHADIVPE